MKTHSLNFIYDLGIKEFEDVNPNTLMMNEDLQIFWPVRIGEMAKLARKLSNALLVIVNDPSINKYLDEHDPKALQQCLDALGVIQA